MYKISFLEPVEHIPSATFATVTDATLFAERQEKPFDVIWAGSGRVLPDWYRQACLELGE